ncbi:Endosulfine-domain-containing protein [Microstroma glucosiphilum]|uniref:mRNA stability protein n=1 Tax=Pseudomicrostroma glucosiphilum TaxID=1684307 RepID=A0A316U091_9BASI|nr:Endosulfine-domain-containing protein [Pseudomicrostroma glucosiphilum]PWN17913.1 Endosulfine-domain-containing protein [Pseudomicrostroma glucosiphilum]
MLPAQRNKVDINSLTEEEQKLFRLYGKLPQRKDLLGNKLKERKYFDSGDYALSKAGKAPQQSVGTAIPNPETIPHASTVSSPPTSNAMPAGSPTGTASTLHNGNGQSPFGSGVAAQGGVGVGAGQPGQGASGASSIPISVPGSMASRQGPTAGSFPTATGMAGSPSGKEGSSLGREEVKAEDAMEE